MIPLRIIGWYGKALVGGHFVVTRPSSTKVTTHTGEVDAKYPLLFVDATNVGGFRFAGQDNAGRGNVEFTDQARVVGQSFGVFPLIYKRDGMLVQVPVGESHQGWRYEAQDGTLVSGDASYHDPVHSISEYTVTGNGDVLVGQDTGSENAVVVVDGIRRLLEPGNSRFIRVDRVGDDFAIAITKLTEGVCKLLWASKTELAALPAFPVVVPTSSPSPAPEPPKPAPSPPTPHPTPVPKPQPGPQFPVPVFPPKEPNMLVLDSQPIDGIAGDPVDNGNGTISIKKANGKFVCLTPDKKYEERDNPGGPWESFVRCSNGLFADRTWDGVPHTFIIPFVEVK